MRKNRLLLILLLSGVVALSGCETVAQKVADFDAWFQRVLW
ncbi:MAG: hypothetical protein Q8Q08_00085 [Candidatus Omnitrophota bacterium]|nr:hypothetical protein [Candidatus Omnitrophota bacterium]MDZ4241441.1 hypothetical protein [Candidatus Omnitrophota bacterium]